MNRLDPSRAVLVVVDVQERLARVMPPTQMEELVRGSRILLESARVLGVRTLVTEQYPQGLGMTLEPLLAPLERARAQKLTKMTFSAVDEPTFSSALTQQMPKQVVVLGMEAHICVFQTVRDLVSLGLEVQVPMDAVVSRREDHRAAGLRLCERAGALISTSESIAFDLLRRAGTEEFRAISQLIR